MEFCPNHERFQIVTICGQRLPEATDEMSIEGKALSREQPLEFLNGFVQPLDQTRNVVGWALLHLSQPSRRRS